MKREIIGIFVLITTVFSVNAQGIFYYYQGNKIDLKVDKTCVNVITNGEIQTSSISNLLYQQFGTESVNNNEQTIVKIKLENVTNEIEYSNIINTLSIFLLHFN
jgi:hypothetical protein